MKRHYEMYSQQTKKVMGAFGPFSLPAEPDNKPNEEDLDEDGATICQSSGLLESRSGAGVNELKNKIMKGHLDFAMPSQKSLMRNLSKSNSHLDNSERVIEPLYPSIKIGTFVDTGDTLQSAGLFSRAIGKI